MKKLFTTILFLLPIVGGFAQTEFMKDFVGPFSRNQSQIAALGGAIPTEKYSWSPDEGVRSVAEVMTHVASANYFFMQSMGFALPEGVDLGKINSMTNKDELLAVVNASFEFVKEKANTLTDANMAEVVELPFGKFSKRTLLFILLDHSGEHKGQLIAYARSNKITPPWSEK